MTYTGIVSSKITPYTYKVRVPELNKAANAIGATPETELYTARVVSCAGIWPEYKVGDTVFVSFLTFGSGSPIILGLQFNETNKSKFSSAHFTDLEVLVNTTLPEETTIGQVSPSNIKCLINLNRNIDEKFTELDVEDQRQSGLISTNISDIAKLTESVGTNTSNIETNRGNIETLSGNLSQLESQFDFHKTNKNDEKHVTTENISQWNTQTNKIINNELTVSMIKDIEPILLTSGVSYGTELPSPTGSNPVKEGQLFFVLASE